MKNRWLRRGLSILLMAVLLFSAWGAAGAEPLSEENPLILAERYLTQKERNFRPDKPGQQLQLLRSLMDDLGKRHIMYQQKVNGVPVYGHYIQLHLDKANRVYAVNNKTEPTLQKQRIDTVPGLTPDEAVASLVSELEIEEGMSIDLSQAIYDTAIMIYPYQGVNYLTYEINLAYDIPELGRWTAYVDAHNGKIIEKYSTIKFSSEKADNVGYNGDTKKLNVYNEEGTYFLYDVTRVGMQGIYTFDYNTSDPETDSIGIASSTDPNGFAPHAVDAHYNAGVVYDYYADKLGRNSIDGAGMAVQSIVHYSEDGNGYDNAFWDGMFGIMVYGNGSGADNGGFNCLACALDVVAHEMTHGVTEYTAGLEYRFQSGALDESISDIMGELIEGAYRNPVEDPLDPTADDPDWLTGADTGATLRSLSDPNLYDQPAHMDEYLDLPLDFDNGGVHINSGIPNKAAYYIATRADAAGFDGEELLAGIVYNALTTYLMPTSNFEDAHTAFILAARDYAEARELNQAVITGIVNQAWQDVGISSEPKFITSFNPNIPDFVPAEYSVWMNTNKSEVYFYVPYGTDVSALNPTVTTSPGTTYEPQGPQDFTAAMRSDTNPDPVPVTYTVYASDNSSRDWYLYAFEGGKLNYSQDVLYENPSGDGSIAGNINIGLINDEWWGDIGTDFVAEGIANVSGLPAGLQAQITIADPKNAVLTFLGQADAAVEGNVDIAIEFESDAYSFFYSDEVVDNSTTIQLRFQSTPPSSDANLSALTVSSGTLTPAFDPATASYDVSVGHEVSSFSITPTAADANATVKVNNEAVTSGSPSSPITLSEGGNTVTVEVTAQDGTTKKTYTIEVNRASAPPAPSSNANLSALTVSAGTLTPAFTAGTASYSASVGNGTASITVTPTAADANATVKVNNEAVTSGSPSSPITLSEGGNTVTVEVTAQDGTTKKTYTIEVNRASAPPAPSSNAELSGLSLSAGTLTPAFTAGTASYSASVGNGTASITVTPTAADASATVKVNNEAVTSGSPSSPITLSEGGNTVTVEVTAQDGTTKKTYTIEVNRASAPPAPSSNAELSGLSLSAGTLTPAFTAGTASYSASVGNGTASITVTPTAADANATVKVNNEAVTSGSPSSPITLSEGGNTVTIEVTAQDGTTKKVYTIIVNRASSTPVFVPGPPPAPAFTVNDEGALFLANNNQVNLQMVNGQMVATITVSEQLIQRMLSALSGQSDHEQLTFSYSGTADAANLEMPLSGLEEWVAESENAAITVKNGGVTYTLPAGVLAEMIQSNPNASISIVISRLDQASEDSLTEAVDGEDGTLLAPGVSFNVNLLLPDGTTVPWEDFNNQFVPRSMELPEGIDAGQATAFVYDPDTGELSFVPFTLRTESGKLIITFWTTHNSIYGVMSLNKTFADIKGHWARQDIERLASSLLLNGTSTGIFTPNKEVSRAEFTAMLVRALGLSTGTEANGYSDVRTSDWYASSVSAAVKAGLLEHLPYGNNIGRFEPNKAITREEMAVMVANALEFAGWQPEQPSMAAGLAPFKDEADISHWAVDSIAAVKDAGIVQGSYGFFRPEATATRAEAAAMLHRILLNLDFIN
ncbi:cadherin-like beta sandwich domain-containing protein [Paenibacillus abyssi]|uniref:cadherin-like beta sandwich domain-containing protein n=1 Tax=Paenibacillus abyssi TaxID=1340531 RepID=UPI00360F3FBC